MIYCDTSLLIAALTPESATAKVQRWLAAREAGGPRISGWVATELSSALALKLRQGELTVEERAEVLTHWRSLLAESLVMLPVPPMAYDLAARFTDRHELGLRAGDALHLAVASLGGHALATLDKRGCGMARSRWEWRWSRFSGGTGDGTMAASLSYTSSGSNYLSDFPIGFQKSDST